MSERMGLTQSEIDWLRANMLTNETAKKLVAQYQMIVACPRDHGARGIFEAMRDDWRRECRQQREDADREFDEALMPGGFV